MNKIKKGVLLVMGCMAQSACSFSQPVSQNSNAPYNYQGSDFAINRSLPLEVIKEENRITVAWNIPYSFDTGYIEFCDASDNTLTTMKLNGRRTGKINLFGNADEIRIFSYNLITDETVIGSYTNVIKPVEKEPIKAMEALSSN
jgi:hypothetical protein